MHTLLSVTINLFLFCIRRNSSQIKLHTAACTIAPSNKSPLLCSTELGSGILSTALQCGTRRCPTDNLKLDTSVQITVEHSEMIKVSYRFSLRQ
jgi:hypothetical protein